MPIALVGDKLHSSANWMRASKGARGLWATALSWCASQGRYDGRVPRYMLRGLGASARDADNLVAAGLWGTEADGFLFLEHFGIRRTGPRADIPPAMRAAVYERDGFACVTCSSGDDLSLDHIIPWSRGGADTVENFQTMCRPCNSSKGATY
jgi:hypothetical protein